MTIPAANSPPIMSLCTLVLNCSFFVKLRYLGGDCFGSERFMELRHLYVDEISDIVDVSTLWPT